MSIADELQKLHALKTAGALTDDEFEQAKQTLLAGSPPVSGVGKTADKWVELERNKFIVGTIISVVVFIVFAIFTLNVVCNIRQSQRETDDALFNLRQITKQHKP